MNLCQDNFFLNGRAFCKLIRSLQENKRIPYIKVKGYGNSMSPFIKSGETIFLRPINMKTKVKTGDIIAVTDKNEEKIIIHRVIGRKNISVQLKGDNCKKDDGWLSQDNIIGIAIQKEKLSGEIVLFEKWKNILIALASKTKILNYCILPFGRCLNNKWKILK